MLELSKGIDWRLSLLSIQEWLYLSSNLQLLRKQMPMSFGQRLANLTPEQVIHPGDTHLHLMKLHQSADNHQLIAFGCLV